MNIVFHGGIGFTNKSHAHIQRNIALGLVELGHEVTVCKIEDANFADSSNPDHNTFKSLCVPEHVYSDYNIWKTGHLEEFKVGGHKFDCLVHNNGNFVLREDIYNQFMALPFTHYIRSGMDAAKSKSLSMDFLILPLMKRFFILAIILMIMEWTESLCSFPLPKAHGENPICAEELILA